MRLLIFLLLVGCVSVPSSSSVDPIIVNQVVELPKLPWNNDEWTTTLVKLLETSTLPDQIAEDLATIQPNYKRSRRDRIIIWAHAIAIMTKYESNYNPANWYKEGFNDSNGKPVISRGLLQISKESANSYCSGCISDPIQLHDVETNLRVGILILNRWVGRHGVFAGGSINDWKGGARYWSVLRSTSDSKPKILAYIRLLRLD